MKTMSRLMVVLLLALTAVFNTASAQQVEVRQLFGDNADSNRIVTAFFAEGYTLAQKEKFFSDAGGMGDYYIQKKPHYRFAGVNQVIALFVASADSGITVPPLGVFRNTFFEASWDSTKTPLLVAPFDSIGRFDTAQRKYS